MPVERAQAGDLALRRRGRERSSIAPSRHLGDEVGQIGRDNGQRIEALPGLAAAGEERAELLQIGAVGLQRVARQPTFELQRPEELKRQLGQPELRVRYLGDRHREIYSPVAGPPPAPATNGSRPLPRQPGAASGVVGWEVSPNYSVPRVSSLES